MTTTEPMMQKQMVQKEEGRITTKIEERTGRIPSGTYLGLAIGSMVVSAGCMLAGKKQIANFIGQWAPSLLVIGLYNKLVKIEHELGYGAYR
ncbi:hypothetical protein predicted by Glimmer/Critica [Sorangium cellulosum So ce56]|uniref:Uncharacterized protein n=1 Tax=Sorangium cellulosum (strain So ce56) TaxID=448385 RepID=A9GE44_SORC5|nr:hypothetical protein [Sorangium cellulosum]CAN99440.1 hypothetical protein predicted by Glimmer/Critica [Sorangium cellulosum So ce56]